MTSPERPRAYTVDAAAAEAGVSRRTIYRLIDDGTLEYVKHGSRRVIPEESLTAYIKANRPKYEVIETPNMPKHLQPYAHEVEKELADQMPIIDTNPDEGEAACSVSNSGHDDRD